MTGCKPLVQKANTLKTVPKQVPISYDALTVGLTIFIF